MIKASGIILCFGFGQGTGQALNFGSIYETTYGFSGGKSFGLTIAAMGFLAASIGGVIYLNYHKKKGDILIRQKVSDLKDGEYVLYRGDQAVKNPKSEKVKKKDSGIQSKAENPKTEQEISDDSVSSGDTSEEDAVFTEEPEKVFSIAAGTNSYKDIA